MRAFRQRYGAHPLHLLGLLASLLVAGYAATKLLSAQVGPVIGWFVGSAVGHDLLLFPAYAGADAALVRLWRRHPGRSDGAPWLNYVRVPVAISLLLLLVYFPSIARRSPVYAYTTDLSTAGYLRRWLLVSATLGLLSATMYVVGRVRRRG